MDHRWGSVILSGGQGSRMGGVDKGGLTYRGIPFRDHIKGQLEALEVPCFLSRACYSNGAGEEDGLEVIEDMVKGADGEWIGPMGGIWSCLQKTGLSGIFFVSCDMPLFRTEMAALLMERWEPGVDAVLWRTRGGRIQPMCGFYASSCLKELETCIGRGNYRMMNLLERIHCVVVDTKEEHIPDLWFANVNSVSAYERLKGQKTPVLAVSGRKDTGKTSLLEMLAGELGRAGIRCAVVKHDGHEFEADVPGTDSRRLKDAGAYGTVVYSGTKFSLTKDQPAMEAEDFFRFFPEADIIFLEGQKYSGYPKLEVLRKEVSREPVCRPETVLAYVWSGEIGWENEENSNCGGDWQERPEGTGPKTAIAPCPVFTAAQKDCILETVIGFLDRAGGADQGGKP